MPPSVTTAKAREPAPVPITQPGADQPARTFIFPAAQSLGMLHAREWNIEDAKAWKPLGPARGEVSVPAGKVVKLVIGQGETKDLTPLSQLSPDALDSLILIGNDLTDAGLAAISGLTGLRRIEITSSKVTDAGLAALKGMSGLRELHLYGLSLTDEGLAALEDLKTLEVLEIAQSGISNSGLVHIKKLTGLRRLIISGTKVSQEGLTVLKYDLPRCEVVQ